MRSEPSADLLAGVGQPAEAAAGGGGRAPQHGHSQGGNAVPQGKRLGRCFYWFKHVVP